MMKTKLFTLFLALVAGVGTMFAWDYMRVQIGDLYYNLDATNQTAEVTYQLNWDENNYKGLTTANIPASVTYNSVSYSVTSIGDYAFFRCSGLTSVTIPNSVTSIGDYAFFRCSGLTSVTIPNSVTSIGVSAFSGCTGLTSIEIPNSVTNIGMGAFDYCSGLISMTVAEGNTLFDSRDNCNAIIESATNSLIAGCQNTTIPNSVTSIGVAAFSGCTGLTSIEIPNSVTSILANAFYVCSGLTSVTIGNSVTSIGDFAFEGCSGLTSVTIGNSVTSIGVDPFAECNSLIDIIAPAAVFDIRNIGQYLSNCQLQSVEISSGEMTNNAFEIIRHSYKTLRKLNLAGATNTTLADEVFRNYYNLDSLRLPSQLIEIGYMSVAECVNLKEITIPATVQTIQQRAFENCRSIQTVTFAGNDLTEIGNWAFYNNHALQQISIPEGVTRIGDGAFYGCTYLDSLNLPSTLNYVGDNAFALCSRVRAIDVDAVIPPSLASKTFQDVNRMIPVRVPDASVTAYRGDVYWSEFNIIGQSEAPTGIETISQSDGDLNASSDGKFIRDGRLYIRRDGKTYTLQGQEVK